MTNVNKPSKIRVEFDAGARYKNTSLNENLPKGPDLLNNPVGILLRFRKGRDCVMTGKRIHVGMDEMYVTVHQATYRFFGIDEMYGVVMDKMYEIMLI